MPLLFLLVVVTGACSLMFDIAYQAFLPSVVGRSRLVEGNSRLELSRTASELVGPGLGGFFIQLFGAPIILLLNGALYLGSAILIGSIRVREQVDTVFHQRDRRMTTRIRAGIDVVWRTRPLREVVGAYGVLNLFNATLEAVFILYVVRVLQVGPATLGIIFGIGGLGFVIGALLPSIANQTLGIGVTSALALALIGASDLLVPLAEGTGWLTIPFLVAAQFFFGVGMTLFNVNQASIRQLTVPPHLLGRASATARFVAIGMVPIGALMGGLLGETIGLRQTLLLAAIGEIAAAVLLWFSPLRGIQTLADQHTSDPEGVSM
jgi:Na+/melibiose symporter-like transporter